MSESRYYRPTPDSVLTTDETEALIPQWVKDREVGWSARRKSAVSSAQGPGPWSATPPDGPVDNDAEE